MAKFRKKPVEVEAIQFDFAPTTADAIVAMAGPDWEKYLTFDEDGIHIETLEGTMTGSDGDYIIKGVQGELYPCKPDIFEETYDKAEGGREWPCEERASLCTLWIVVAPQEGGYGYTVLPSYTGITEREVGKKVLDRAYAEGYTGNLEDRLEKLGWKIVKIIAGIV